jgi:hypothetical protein
MRQPRTVIGREIRIGQYPGSLPKRQNVSGAGSISVIPRTMFPRLRSLPDGCSSDCCCHSDQAVQMSSAKDHSNANASSGSGSFPPDSAVREKPMRANVHVPLSAKADPTAIFIKMPDWFIDVLCWRLHLTSAGATKELPCVLVALQSWGKRNRVYLCSLQSASWNPVPPFPNTGRNGWATPPLRQGPAATFKGISRLQPGRTAYWAFITTVWRVFSHSRIKSALLLLS